MPARLAVSRPPSTSVVISPRSLARAMIASPARRRGSTKRVRNSAAKSGSVSSAVKTAATARVSPWPGPTALPALGETSASRSARRLPSSGTSACVAPLCRRIASTTSEDLDSQRR